MNRNCSAARGRALAAMSRGILLVVISISSLASPAVSRAADPGQIYRESLQGVVWIVNWDSAGDRAARGSGFLVDRERRLVVTNSHVVGDERTMDVLFPVPDVTGKRAVVENRDYYIKNAKRLAPLGYYAVGRVVARDVRKDLAILRLSGLPRSAVALGLADQAPGEGDRLNMIGNPGDRPLWRWSAGYVHRVERFVTVFEDHHAVDFEAVRFFADGFGGNSGGPVLDDHGQVVGVEESGGGGAGGMETNAVLFTEVRDLLGSIKPQRVFRIENRTRFPIGYRLTWSDGDSKFFREPAGGGRTHWWRNQSECSIRFDGILTPGVQDVVYRLQYRIAEIGRGGAPDPDRDALAYQFRANGQRLDLYRSR